MRYVSNRVCMLATIGTPSRLANVCARVPRMSGVETWMMSGRNWRTSARIARGRVSARRNSVRLGSVTDGTGTSVPAGSNAGVSVTGE